MKTNTHTQTLKLCTAALMLAVGVLLPQVFHMIGGQSAGGMFLPMHIPVLIAGLLLGPFYGGAIGIITPIISLLITGMPPAAKLPFMLVELAGYGIASGLLRSKSINIYISLIISQIAGRACYVLALICGTYIFGLNIPPLVTATTALVTGLPGIAIQLILIPAIVVPVEKALHFVPKKNNS